MIEANHRFHRIHNRVADNEEALEAVERTNTLLTALRTTYGYHKERILQICSERSELISSFEMRDVKSVMAVHARHCENAKSNLLRIIDATEKQEASTRNYG